MPGARERRAAQRVSLLRGLRSARSGRVGSSAGWIRRAQEATCGGSFPRPHLVVTPQADDPEIAQGWLEDLAARGFEGIVAKQTCLPYPSGKRAMVKVKRWRSADLVVGGYLGPPGESLVLAPWRLRRARGPASRRPDRALLPPGTGGAPCQVSPPRGGSELRRRADAWPGSLGAPAL